MRSFGSQHPSMYGLPKIHKINVPLRSILSFDGSAQHELAKSLVDIFDLVLKTYSNHCIIASFQFTAFVLKFKRTECGSADARNHSASNLSLTSCPIGY